MANLRQSILIREDLNLPVGLLTAQVAHIHFEAIRQKLLLGSAISNDEQEWLKDPYTFVHKVPNIEILEYFEKKAHKEKVPLAGWSDTIYQEIGMEKIALELKVGIALGPCDSDKIKKVIGALPLL